MDSDFDLYIPGDSFFHRLDPRVKLLLIAVVTILLFQFPHIIAVTAALLLLHGLLLISGVSLQRIRSLWRLLLPLTLLIPTLWLIFQPGPGPAFFTIGPLRLTWSGLLLGVTVALRLDALAFVVFLWLFTTDQATMIRGLTALGLPYTWSLTLSLALRYIPTIAGLYQQVVDAQRARGLDLDSGSLWRRLQVRQPILVAVIISALRTSQGIAWSMEARGLGAPGIRRTQFHRLRFTPTDWAATCALVATVLGAQLIR
ncbi:MAG: energy-coupling factor transporter transmembrane protein EcfT [Anaerolineae bacterium]|nr:energy-coupling factor transporter transmembrane protein EcfT [Anaerolineae bacterium]